MAWPTSKNPKTKFVTLRLTEDENDDLDALCASTGESRSDAVRTAVHTAVKRMQKKTG